MDRNVYPADAVVAVKPSLSARRAWIEITYVTRLPCAQVVALRKESVDRNDRRSRTIQNAQIVALRKESVDRNLGGVGQALFLVKVALRKESVDRNDTVQIVVVVVNAVALRKESVDRNLLSPLVAGSLITSLSARRAWIEIILSR